MMGAARDELARLRRDPAAWPELGCRPVTEANGSLDDGNRVRRAAVLWALQYDSRAADLPLLRWLVEQEATWWRAAPFQGLSEPTELAGYLLAEHRQVADVWRHWMIKRANFDTWCGYDVEHLVAAGALATTEFVAASEHPDRAAVLELLAGAGPVTEAGLDEWFDRGRRRFPADPATTDPITWFDRAVLAGAPELAREYLDRWAAGQQRDRPMLGELCYQLTRLGDFPAAASVRREYLSCPLDPPARASGWRSLAELERGAGNHRAAWAALTECDRTLDSVPGWQRTGLGRHYVEELFRLARAADRELAAEVFERAHRVLPTVDRLPLVVLEVAVDAAERVARPSRVRWYRATRDTERERVEQATGGGFPAG